MSRIRCMRFSDRLKSPKNSGHAHYSDAIECDPNYRNTSHEHKYERFTLHMLCTRKSNA